MSGNKPAVPSITPPARRFPRRRAYSYLRFSHSRQAGGDSWRRQLEASRAYAKEHDLELQEATFADLGLSAYRGANLERGALAAFIKAVESGSITPGSYLLVEDFDRLSRAEVAVAMGLFLRLVAAGIVVVTLKDGRVWDQEAVRDTTNLLLSIIFMGRAHDESASRAKRIRAVHQAKRERRDPAIFGQGPAWLNRKPDGSGWEVRAGCAESIRRVFELSLQGWGSAHIARRANAEGWPAPAKVKRWNTTLPNKLLRNRAVLGEYTPNLAQGGKRVPTGEVWKDYYPRIVDDKTFLLAQSAAHARRTLPMRRDAGYHNVLQGLAYCGHCGQPLLRKRKSGGRNAEGYAQFICGSRHCGERRCPTHNAQQLERRLLPALIRSVASAMVKTDRLEALRTELSHRDALLRNAQDGASRLVRALEEGTSSLVISRLRELERTVERETRAVDALRAELDVAGSHLYEDDIEAAVDTAMMAVLDHTNHHATERAALRGRLAQGLLAVWVWPDREFAALMTHAREVVLLPLTASTNVMALLAQPVQLPPLPKRLLADSWSSTPDIAGNDEE